MPIYEYECGACGHRFERLVTAGTERTGCPECGAEGAKRIWVSAPAPSPKLVVSGRQDRLMQAKRGVDRAPAKERWKARRRKQREKGINPGSSHPSSGLDL